VLHANSSHLAEAASALVEHGMKPDTPVGVTSSGTINTQRTLDTTLASLAQDAGELVGPLIVTVGAAVGARAKLSWWESRALYGWKVLVPRTKEQAGEMADRLRSHGATSHEVPTISVEPPRSPAQMERSVKELGLRGLKLHPISQAFFPNDIRFYPLWEKCAELGVPVPADELHPCL
jgi:uroporphyrinogen III methyltransferase / synthase